MRRFPGRGNVLGKSTGIHTWFTDDSSAGARDPVSFIEQMGEASSSKSVSSLPQGRNGGTQRWAPDGDEDTGSDDEDAKVSAATNLVGKSFRPGRSRGRGSSSSSSSSSRSRRTSYAPLPLLGNTVQTLPLLKGYIGIKRLEKLAIEARLYASAAKDSMHPRLLVARVEEPDNKAILDVRISNITDIAVHASEDGDPEYPSFLALSTVSNERSATGYARVCESYRPNESLMATDPASRYILLVLGSEGEALDRFKGHINDALSNSPGKKNVLLHEIEAPSGPHEHDRRGKYLGALRHEAANPRSNRRSQQQRLDQQYFSPCRVGQTVKPGVIAVGSDDDDDDDDETLVEPHGQAISTHKRRAKPRQKSVCDDPSDGSDSNDDDDDDDGDFVVDDMNGSSGYTTKPSSKSKRKDSRGKSRADKAPKKAQKKKSLKRRRSAGTAGTSCGSETEWIQRAGTSGTEQQAGRSSKRVAEKSKAASASTALEDTDSSDFEMYQTPSTLAPSLENAAAETENPRERESIPSWATGINSLPDDDPRLAQVLFRYPEGATAQDPVPINLGDVRRLRSGQFLNDNLIDFWLKYSFNKRIENAIAPLHSEDDQDLDLVAMSKKVHIFSSHFYTKLAEQRKSESPTHPEADGDAGHARHRRVRRWTKAMNIFEYDFILVPVNMDLHWSLAIICYPGELVKQFTPADSQNEVTHAENDGDEDTLSEHSSESSLEGGGRGLRDSNTESLHSNVCEMMNNQEQCDGKVAATVDDVSAESNAELGLTNDASIDLCDSSDEDVASGRESEDYGPPSKVTPVHAIERSLADAAREAHSTDLSFSQETVPYSQEDQLEPEPSKAFGGNPTIAIPSTSGDDTRQGKTADCEEQNRLINELLDTDNAEDEHTLGPIESKIQVARSHEVSYSSNLNAPSLMQCETTRFDADVGEEVTVGATEGDDENDKDGVVLVEDYETSSSELPVDKEGTEVGGDGRFPCILIMDSLRYHDSDKICAYLRDWLNHEYAARAKSAHSGNPEKANAASAQTQCNDPAVAAQRKADNEAPAASSPAQNTAEANENGAPLDSKDECEEDSVVPMEAEAAKQAAAAMEASRMDSAGPASEQTPVSKLFNEESLPKVEPEVPRQENSWDCGVFVLAYADAVMDLCPEILGAPCIPTATDSGLHSGTRDATESDGENSCGTRPDNLSTKFSKDLVVADQIAARAREATARLKHLKTVFGASLFDPRADIRARRRRLRYLVFRLCTSIPSKTLEAPTAQAHANSSSIDATRTLVDSALSKSLPPSASSDLSSNGESSSVTQPALLDSPPRAALTTPTDDVMVLSGDPLKAPPPSDSEPADADYCSTQDADEQVNGKRINLDFLQTFVQEQVKVSTKVSHSSKKADPEATESDYDDSSSSDEDSEVTASSMHERLRAQADKMACLKQSPKRFKMHAAPDTKTQQKTDKDGCSEVRGDSEEVDTYKLDGENEVGSTVDDYDPSGSFKPATWDQGRKKQEIF